MSSTLPRIGRETTGLLSPGADRWPMICIPSPGWLSTRSAKSWARRPVPAISMNRASWPWRRMASNT